MLPQASTAAENGDLRHSNSHPEDEDAHSPAWYSHSQAAPHSRATDVSKKIMCHTYMALASSPAVSFSPCFHQAKHICKTLACIGVSTSNRKAGQLLWHPLSHFMHCADCYMHECTARVTASSTFFSLFTCVRWCRQRLPQAQH